MPPAENNIEIRNCHSCSDEISGDEIYVFHDNHYCESCLDDQTTFCSSCHNREWNDDVYYMANEDYYCNDCYSHSDCFSCDNCDGRFAGDNMGYSDDDDILCIDCASERGGSSRSYPDTSSTELQSKKLGEIVKSYRKFGIELECVFDKTDAKKKLSELLNKSWGFSDDGSLRRSKNSLGTCEIISPIMSGKAGETEIKKLSANANKIGFGVNKSCGYHLHLDAPEYKRDTKEDYSEEVQETDVYAFVDTSNIGGHPQGYIISTCRKSDRNFSEWVKSYSEKYPGDKFQILPYHESKVAMRNKGAAFYRLRNLWYVYIAFDDVFRSMQPMSRRNNTHCTASSSLYSLDQIRDLQDFAELEALWYRVDRRMKLVNQIHEVNDRKRGKDGSRYTGFNLEPLLRDNSNNIEFRYHSPTFNAEKILRWVDIHQTILDQVAKGINEDTINHIVSSETHLIRKAKAMCYAFGIKEATMNYITARIQKFNKLSKEDIEDEEVQDSDIGRPNRINNLRMSRPSSMPGGAYVTSATSAVDYQTLTNRLIRISEAGFSIDSFTEPDSEITEDITEILPENNNN